MRIHLSIKALIQVSIRLLLHASLAWMWEYSLRNSLITSDNQMIDYVSCGFVLIASVSEFIAMIPHGFHPNKAIVASFVFAIGWIFFRHIILVNIIWSFALTYMTWANPSPFYNPLGKEYVMAAFLTFLATAGVEITQTHWVGVIIRMIPTLG